MEYIVTIEETVNEDFKVEASSKEEAEEIARQHYRQGWFVLEPGNLIDVTFTARKPDKN